MHQRIEVMRGTHRAPDELFGPLPGVRLEDVVAYEFELPDSFEPWPGRSRLERTFVMLDVGVSFANPCWSRYHRPDGQVIEWDVPGTWYVDLVSVQQAGSRYTFLDLYIDRYPHVDQFPQGHWSDFPPSVIKPLLDMDQPFGESVRWHEGL